jgi:hypothetical protein
MVGCEEQMVSIAGDPQSLEVYLKKPFGRMLQLEVAVLLELVRVQLQRLQVFSGVNAAFHLRILLHTFVL